MIRRELPLTTNASPAEPVETMVGNHASNGTCTRRSIMTHHDSSGRRSLISEPIRIRIAAGWFSMGSEAGQTVESPIHRVWLDSFAIAATQVTVQEYGRFLDATGTYSPQTGAIPTSLILSNLWWRFRGLTLWHIARGFRQ